MNCSDFCRLNRFNDLCVSPPTSLPTLHHPCIADLVTLYEVSLNGMQKQKHLVTLHKREYIYRGHNVCSLLFCVYSKDLGSYLGTMIVNYCLLFLMLCCVICKRDPASEQLSTYKLSKVSTLLKYCQFQSLLAIVNYIVCEDLEFNMTSIFVL
jgi:hypothetical protein